MCYARFEKHFWKRRKACGFLNYKTNAAVIFLLLTMIRTNVVNQWFKPWDCTNQLITIIQSWGKNLGKYQCVHAPKKCIYYRRANYLVLLLIFIVNSTISSYGSPKKIAEGINSVLFFNQHCVLPLDSLHELDILMAFSLVFRYVWPKKSHL